MYYADIWKILILIIFYLLVWGGRSISCISMYLQTTDKTSNVWNFHILPKERHRASKHMQSYERRVTGRIP